MTNTKELCATICGRLLGEHDLHCYVEEIDSETSTLYRDAARLIQQLQARCEELERECDMFKDAEMQWEKSMMNAIGEDGIKSVCDAIATLKRERDSLKVHIKNGQGIEEAHERIADEDEEYRGSYVYGMVERFLTETPQQSLSALKMEVAREAFIKGANWYPKRPTDDNELIEAAQQYATAKYGKE